MITEVEFDQKLFNSTIYCNRKGVPVAMEKIKPDISLNKISNFNQAGKMSYLSNYSIKVQLFLPFIKQNMYKRCYF